MSKTSSTMPKKVQVVEYSANPLRQLLDTCGSIEAPDPPKLKDMLQDYQVVVDSALWYSIFATEWPDFYNLPALLEAVRVMHATPNLELSRLCEEILDDVKNCQESIEAVVNSRPEPNGEDSRVIEEAFYDLILDRFHTRLKRICTQLKEYYLGKLLQAIHMGPSLPPAVLSEGQREVWDLLENQCLDSSELAKKLHSSEDCIRKRVQAIRERLGKDAIGSVKYRGYYRPDAPPPDAVASEV